MAIKYSNSRYPLGPTPDLRYNGMTGNYSGPTPDSMGRVQSSSNGYFPPPTQEASQRKPSSVANGERYVPREFKPLGPPAPVPNPGAKSRVPPLPTQQPVPDYQAKRTIGLVRPPSIESSQRMQERTQPPQQNKRGPPTQNDIFKIFPNPGNELTGQPGYNAMDPEFGEVTGYEQWWLNKIRKMRGGKLADVDLEMFDLLKSGQIHQNYDTSSMTHLRS